MVSFGFRLIEGVLVQVREHVSSSINIDKALT